MLWCLHIVKEKKKSETEWMMKIELNVDADSDKFHKKIFCYHACMQQYKNVRQLMHFRFWNNKNEKENITKHCLSYIKLFIFCMGCVCVS